jgi:hypothetical protein
MFDDRWVYPDPDRNDEAGKKLAILKGAARAADLTDDVFKAKFMELSILLPGMSAQRLMQLDRVLLAQLASDTSGVARRLISLQALFPTADLAKLVSKRPGLLLESIFRHVPAAREELAALFPQADIDAMVQEQPLLLTEDIASCIAELQRLMPMTDPLQTLRFNPHIVVSVMDNRGLSLW